ncbi:MAG: NfeD family protein [Oscillatoria sp. PMC 1051.18]|nr:NfeD family protein [Oscillatoria sp. PMC 1050.18]MEC5031292.1 NfeD family protein [Oscillatoria sp. PMC 1051.18]
MLSIYFFCFLIGGIFVALSVVAGFDGVEFDNDFDTDLEITDTPDEEEESGRRTQLKYRGIWLPIFSLRFWTFGTCFFGLTGILLSRLELSPEQVAYISLAIGIFCGTAIAWVLRSLRRRKVDSLVRSHDLIGLEATVEIPFAADSRGKVSVSVKGSTVALLAYTEEDRDFAVGETVYVVGMEENRVWVVSAEKFMKD